MTKKAYREFVAAYRLALAEGRVVKFGDTTFKTFATHEEAVAAADEASKSGLNAVVVSGVA